MDSTQHKVINFEKKKHTTLNIHADFPSGALFKLQHREVVPKQNVGYGRRCRDGNSVLPG